MNTQAVLDWRLCHGSKYKYDDLVAATGLSRKRLYRMRYQCAFGNHGVFTYGESLALLFAHHAHINVGKRDNATVVMDLAWKIDHLSMVDDFNAYIVEQRDGTKTAHVGYEDTPTKALFTLVVHLPSLALDLANAHARLQTVTQ